MTTIATGKPLLTLINVFTVAPEKQHELVALLERATDEVMREQTGFISANIHVGHDGTHVVNYAQWASKDDFNNMLANPEAAEHMKACSDIAQAMPVTYDVAAVFEAPENNGR